MINRMKVVIHKTMYLHHPAINKGVLAPMLFLLPHPTHHPGGKWMHDVVSFLPIASFSDEEGKNSVYLTMVWTMSSQTPLLKAMHAQCIPDPTCNIYKWDLPDDDFYRWLNRAGERMWDITPLKI
jgi:hypothetical protein